jgi:NAD(P)-dependent dehydrogenase (short-subunit alcohol dehydrogenase family)
MTERLNGKIAIVTGAAGGIGAATAALFVRHGARVLLADQNGDQVTATTKDIDPEGDQTIPLAVDVQHESAVENMIRQALDRWGRLDILVNNAGVASGMDVLSATDAEFDRVLAVNVKGPLLCCKHALPAMLNAGGGAIVNVASISATCGIPGQAIYAPSKAAVAQLTRQLAIEFADRNIRVNAVSPGTIETPMIDALLRDPARRPKLDWLRARHPIGRFGRADEVAAAILFLASDDASFITGANLPVDGGYTAQ